jgi:hypothetical protein
MTKNQGLSKFACSSPETKQKKARGHNPQT